MVDTKHLTAAQFWLAERHRYPDTNIAWELAALVERTAEEFGYAFQLEENYNIDMHAELQYYQPGIYGPDINIFYRSPDHHHVIFPGDYVMKPLSPSSSVGG
ncbi:hypothetical protein BD410DRAFT_844710 [Rickenella mellea]|uniref:Uncharacterized protein n=1 Tax=Rickenella mellea TaxID=50990 RepID=A0A4Y7PLC0_9AGAM|nr:hypothetical protein BD410DRAFT_844710 [Rickenella mellea]